MIKKVNIALVVVFAAMFVVKGLKTKSSPKSAAPEPSPAAEAAEGASSLAPNAYYSYWAGYTLENPISNRNGILLDIVRAVFPKVSFEWVRDDVSEIAEKLRTDERAVAVGFGVHEALAGFPSAPTPLMRCPLVLMTLRTNPWCYTDFSSLTNLRIVASDALLDYTVLKELNELTARGGARLHVLSNGVTKVDMGEMVLRGEADAMAVADLQGEEGVPKDGLASTEFIQNFRRSPEIACEGTLLYTSGLNAEFSRKVVEDFEKGLRRIAASGELRRICEYYGVPYAPPEERRSQEKAGR